MLHLASLSHTVFLCSAVHNDLFPWFFCFVWRPLLFPSHPPTGIFFYLAICFTFPPSLFPLPYQSLQGLLSSLHSELDIQRYLMKIQLPHRVSQPFISSASHWCFCCVCGCHCNPHYHLLCGLVSIILLLRLSHMHWVPEVFLTWPERAVCGSSNI